MQDKDTELLTEALSKVYIKESSLNDWHAAQVDKVDKEEMGTSRNLHDPSIDSDPLTGAFESWFIENFPPERIKEKKMLWFAFQEGSKFHASNNRHIDEPTL